MKLPDKDKKTILWVTDDPFQSTGYGMVGRNILGRLNKTGKYNLYALGLQHRGKDILYDGYWVLPCFQNPDGFDALPHYINILKPDIIVTLRDVGIQAGYIPFIQKARQEGWTGKWYGYVPIDSNTIAWGWDDFFKEMDIIIAMSEWGQKMIKEQTGLDSVFIPHGVDTKVFRPLSKEEIEKKIGDAPFKECFVVGAVGRNQYRKMWNVLLRGFGVFCKNKTDVALLLHTDSTPANQSDGWDFNFISRKYNCKDKYMLTFPNMSIHTRFLVDDEKMNDIFNSFDIFCFPTGGEGFGIPILEAQSSGIPVITTAYTTGFELVGNHGRLIKIRKDYKNLDIFWEGQNGVEFCIPDWDDVADALEEYYNLWKNKPEEFQKLKNSAREHALKYDWEEIVKLWDKLFTDAPSHKIGSKEIAKIIMELASLTNIPSYFKV